MNNEKNVEIGRYFGIKGSPISEVLKEVEARAKIDRKFKKEIEALKRTSFLVSISLLWSSWQCVMTSS